MSELVMAKKASPPTPPDIGEVTVFPDIDGNMKVIDENGGVSGFDKIYGSNYKKNYNNQTVTNSSDIPLLYNSMIMLNISAGAVIKISAFAVWNMSVTNKLFNSILYVNGVEIGSLSEKTNDTGSDVRNPRSGFFFYTNPLTQDLTIELKFAPQSAGPTASMYYGAIEGKRVE